MLPEEESGEFTGVVVEDRAFDVVDAPPPPPNVADPLDAVLSPGCFFGFFVRGPFGEIRGIRVRIGNLL